MTEITYWHKFAHLFLVKELELAEIGKVWIINSAIGVGIDDSTRSYQYVSFNVLDNSDLNRALVLSILSNLPDNRPISQPELSKMILLHPNTVANTVKRLIADGLLEKKEQLREGTIYTVLDVGQLPLWLMKFTQAIVELHTNEQLRNDTAAACKNIEFKRGIEVLKSELREKFYRK